MVVVIIGMSQNVDSLSPRLWNAEIEEFEDVPNISPYPPLYLLYLSKIEGNHFQISLNFSIALALLSFEFDLQRATIETASDLPVLCSC